MLNSPTLTKRRLTSQKRKVKGNQRLNQETKEFFCEATLNINDINIKIKKALIDTGSTLNIIREDSLRKDNILISHPVKANQADGTRFSWLKKIGDPTLIQVKTKTGQINLTTHPNIKHKMVIGIATTRKLELIKTHDTQTEWEIEALNQNVFSPFEMIPKNDLPECHLDITEQYKNCRYKQKCYSNKEFDFFQEYI
jgi:hypothetical protein